MPSVFSGEAAPGDSMAMTMTMVTMTWIYESMRKRIGISQHGFIRWRLKLQWNDLKHTLLAAALWDLPCLRNRLGISGVSYRTLDSTA